MTEWIVSCDSCPYRQRFQTRSQADQNVARHATENPRHNPKVSEEER
jgi:hypothetical protein